MANVKNITNLPMAESTEGLNLIVNDNGAAKQIAADKIGGGGASSWNDLKDKPFYEEVTETILGSQNNIMVYWASEQEQGYTNSINIPNLQFELGEKYNLVLNDVIYSDLICDVYDGLPYIGNTHPEELWESDKSKTLFFLEQDGESLQLYINQNIGEASITISKIDTVVKPLDEKYIPKPTVISFANANYRGTNQCLVLNPQLYEKILNGYYECYLYADIENADEVWEKSINRVDQIFIYDNCIELWVQHSIGYNDGMDTMSCISAILFKTQEDMDAYYEEW